MGRFQISLVAERPLHHRLEVLSQLVSKLFPHSRSPRTDTPGILLIEVAQVARISELIEALVGPEPGEAGEEAVELPTSAPSSLQASRGDPERGLTAWVPPCSRSVQRIWPRVAPRFPGPSPAEGPRRSRQCRSEPAGAVNPPFYLDRPLGNMLSRVQCGAIIAAM